MAVGRSYLRAGGALLLGTVLLVVSALLTYFNVDYYLTGETFATKEEAIDAARLASDTFRLPGTKKTVEDLGSSVTISYSWLGLSDSRAAAVPDGDRWRLDYEIDFGPAHALHLVVTLLVIPVGMTTLVYLALGRRAGQRKGGEAEPTASSG